MAYAELRRAIVRAELKPGAALSESEVALRLGVSRGPVRQAFWQLALEGFLEVSPQVGTNVSRISVQRLTDVLFVREAVECAAAQLALRAAPADRRRLMDCAERQRQAVEAGDVEEGLRQDEAFHRTLLELAGHGTAWPLVQQARAHLERVRRLAIPELRGSERAVEQHQSIAAALSAGDAEATAARLSNHMSLVSSFVAELREQHPDYFED